MSSARVRTISDPLKPFNTNPEIIKLAVMYDIRYPLSLCWVEDIVHESQIDICHEIVRFWWNRY